MRYLISAFFLTLLFVACQEKKARYIDKDEKITSLSFDKIIYSFDTIKQGEKVNITFEISNTGTEDLQIEKALATCGCTVPNWPKQAIKPGEKGTMYVVFDSNKKRGVQNKVITVFANTIKGKEEVRLKGFVKTEINQ
ncbi:DUF1573 domain-containing protein [Flavobacteriaceae bacterium]|nr:DUF1573 domain-containing protein [Flavobacteriaceae bacterium]